MFKKLFLIYLLFAGSFILAQDSTHVEEEESDDPMLLGIVSRETFKDTTYSWWFESQYNNYEVNAEDLDDVPAILRDYSIKLVIGTWCSDSRREMPRLLKILDSINFPPNNITLIAVDRYKKAPGNELDEIGSIELVPTFIFYSNGKEMGRITEAPNETLEADIYKIVHSASN